MAETGDKIEPVILVHGGAGNIDNSRIANHLNGVRAAARTGYKVYSETSSILEATINAVKVLENDETFNAGRGSVLTYDGEIEMEALIMDGKTLKAGAVTLLKNIANPIEVARLVMEKTPHVLLSGNSAKKLATDYGIFHTDDSYFFTEKSKRALEKFHQERKKQEQSGTNEQPCDGETVGAIGIDANGNVVSCTSTGGRVGKITGRVGDTPIPGSGGYADNSIGTVSTTGNGDAILTYNLSLRIMTAMELAHILFLSACPPWRLATHLAPHWLIGWRRPCVKVLKKRSMAL